MSSEPEKPIPERPEFITLIAVYQFVTGGILLLLSCLVTTAIIPLMFLAVPAAEGAVVGLFLLVVVLALLLGFGVASVIVGWGLLRMRGWARLGAIILAAFALIGFPIWTIVAILILVYLTSDDARAAFNEFPESQSAEQPPGANLPAIYKAEPPRPVVTDPTQETRRMTAPPPPTDGNGGNGHDAPTEETRRIDQPIPMPPGEELTIRRTDVSHGPEDVIPDEPTREMPPEPTPDDQDEPKPDVPHGSEDVIADEPTAEMSPEPTPDDQDEPKPDVPHGSEDVIEDESEPESEDDEEHREQDGPRV